MSDEGIVNWWKALPNQDVHALSSGSLVAIIEDMVTEIERLREFIGKSHIDLDHVRPYEWIGFSREYPLDCEGCGESWPCPTAKVLGLSDRTIHRPPKEPNDE